MKRNDRFECFFFGLIIGLIIGAAFVLALIPSIAKSL